LLGVIAPKKPSLILKVLFVLLLVPSLAKFIERMSYLWHVPYPQTGDIVFETCLTVLLLWLVAAVASLVFSGSESEPHVVA
jgi:hypothetical protein